MNKYEKFKTLDIDTLAKWLDANMIFDTAPHNLWFDKKFCSNCESVKFRYSDGESTSRDIECTYCEINGHCRFFPELETTPDSLFILKMWLEQEADTKDFEGDINDN